MLDIANDSDQRNGRKGYAQGNVEEKQSESAAAQAEGTAVTPDDAKGCSEDVQDHTDAVGGMEVLFGAECPDQMEDQNRDGDTEKEIGIVVQRSCGKDDQKDMHDEGREVDVFHNTPPFGNIIQEPWEKDNGEW